MNMTDSAKAKAIEFLSAENKTGYGLRVYVKGGGCHGYQYGMAFEEKPDEMDHVIDLDGIRLFVDPQSFSLLDGAEIGYVDNLHGSGFTVKNPNAKTSCGCGSSFGT